MKGDKALRDLCDCQSLAQLGTAQCGHPSFSAASAAGQILTRPSHRWVSVGNSEEHDWQTTDECWLEHLSQSLKQPRHPLYLCVNFLAPQTIVSHQRQYSTWMPMTTRGGGPDKWTENISQDPQWRQWADSIPARGLSVYGASERCLDWILRIVFGLKM